MLRVHNLPGAQVHTHRAVWFACRLAAARRGAERRPAGGSPSAGAAIVRPRQHCGGPVHRQLPDRIGPARRKARQRCPDRRGSNRVCRCVRTSGGRLHPIHLRRSSQAGPDCNGRRPRRGIRAQVSTAALSRHTAPVRVRRSEVSRRRPAWGQRDRCRSRQRLSARDRGHPATAAPDQAGVHASRVRASWTVLASRAREGVPAISRPAEVCLVRRSVRCGRSAPQCEPARQLGDRVCHFRHGHGRSCVCRRATVCRAPRRGQCTLVRRPERVPGSGSRRRIAAVHRRPQSRHGRRGRSTPERRTAEQPQSDAKAPGATDIRLARVTALGHPREPVAARERRALSRSEPLERTSGHGAERRRRAGRPIAPDCRTCCTSAAPDSAPRWRAGATWGWPPTPIAA